MPCPKGTEMRCGECLLSSKTRRNQCPSLVNTRSIPKLREEHTSSSLSASAVGIPVADDCGHVSKDGGVPSTTRPGTAITNATSSNSSIDSSGEDDNSVTSPTAVLSTHGKVPIAIPSHNPQALRNPWSTMSVSSQRTSKDEPFKSNPNKRKSSSTIPLASFSAFSSTTTAFSSPKKMCPTFPPTEDDSQRQRTMDVYKRETQEEIIERIRHENDQLKLQAFYLENIPDIIVVFGENGILKYVSPSVNTFVNYTAIELIGTCFWNLLCHDSATLLIQSANESLQGRPAVCKQIRISEYVLELNLKDTDGTLRPMALNGVVLFQDRSAEYICSVSHRESPKTKAQAELARLRWLGDVEEVAGTVPSGNSHSATESKDLLIEQNQPGQQQQHRQEALAESKIDNQYGEIMLEKSITDPHHDQDTQDKLEEGSNTNQLPVQPLSQASNLNGHEQTLQGIIISSSQSTNKEKNSIGTHEEKTQNPTMSIETAQNHVVKKDSVMIDVVNAH